ncbi:MAG: LysM peptidoglycan-binding domain-containing protein [Phycisphaeraceae bacterium]|nr:LysM peptidoglycan-binding domain-containing protein [Phycisphaeraceae bacterium]
MTLASQSVRPVRTAGPGTNNTPPRGRPWWARARTPRQNAVLAGAGLLGVLAIVIGVKLTSGGTPKSVEAGTSPGSLSVSDTASKPISSPPATSSLVRRTPNAQPQPPVTPPVVMDTAGRPATGTTPGDSAPAAAATPLATPADSAPAPAAAIPSPAATELASEIQQTITAAERARQDGKYLEARILLNKALVDPRTADSEKEALRSWMAEINESLVFSPAVTKGDPLTDTYVVQSGDSLVRIAARQGLGVDYRFIQRINKMSDPGRLQVGQKLKVVRGPFHVVVDKSAFRMDVWAGSPPSPGSLASPSSPDGVEPDWVYIRSFKVGLGEHGLTPVGAFIVKPRSKLVNPPWINPRTGQKFAADDPANPIGERWMGLEGVDEATRTAVGYGIHGTIDPSSIGKEQSMGCVRMGSNDVDIVWEMLQEGVSVVRIVP